IRGYVRAAPSLQKHNRTERPRNTRITRKGVPFRVIRVFRGRVFAMNSPQELDDLMTCRLTETRKALEPCSIVIFGASGDLTARKLIPAFYHLCKEKQMPGDFRIIGFARREKTDASWREELRQALDQFSRTKPVDDGVWTEFATSIHLCSV